MSQSLARDRQPLSMLGIGGRTTSHLNYLDVQPYSACIAGVEPLGATLDWSIHSGLARPVYYV